MTDKPNILAKYYPKWHANCVESARFLRSGAEYEAWCEARQILALSLEERERKAQDYERRAACYLDPNYTGA